MANQENSSKQNLMVLGVLYEAKEMCSIFGKEVCQNELNV